MKNNSPILLIDAYNLFIRNFTANPLMADGNHVGGIVGFLKSLNSLIQQHSPKECIIVWEGGGSIRRRAIYPDYKSKRRPVKLNRFYDDEIPDTVENRSWQIKTLISALKNLPIKQVYISDCEADDIIGYISKYCFKDDKILIVSSDHDYYQLVNEKVEIWSPTLKSIVTKDVIKEKTGMWPFNLVVARCFCGDSSDALPGVKGLGIKTMVKRFPELSGDQEILLESIIDKAHSMPDKSPKVYSLVTENADLGRMNWKLMNLDISNLSWNQISKLTSFLEQPASSPNKFGLIRTLLKAGIKTFDIDRLFLNATINLQKE